MIICIVGSSAWLGKDIPIAKQAIEDYLVNFDPFVDVVISGECPKGGVDSWAKEIAINRGFAFKGYPPEANEKWAYMKRNKQMALDCDVLLRVVSSISKTFGSGITMKWAVQLGKKVSEVKI